MDDSTSFPTRPSRKPTDFHTARPNITTIAKVYTGVSPPSFRVIRPGGLRESYMGVFRALRQGQKGPGLDFPQANPGGQMGSEPVLVARSGEVVTLTLNRPEIRNAMNVELTDAFTDAVAQIGADPDVRAVVVTGAGKAFCSGGDLGWINPGPGASVPEMRRKMRSFYPQFLAVRALDRKSTRL